MATTVVTKSSVTLAGGNTAVATGAAPGPVTAGFTTSATQFAIVSGVAIRGAASPTGLLTISGFGSTTIASGSTLYPGGIHIPPNTTVDVVASGGSGTIEADLMYVLYANS